MASDLLDFVLASYRKEEFPCLYHQYQEWSVSRPLDGVRVFDTTPVFRNTCAKYAALMAAGADLYFDFHGEAHDAAPDEFTSFKVDTDSQSSGSLTAPFTGRAGWYWRNDGDASAVITLSLRGDYSQLHHD